MPDIVIPEEDLPEVQTGQNGWMWIDGEQFPPVTSAKLSLIWAKRYLAVAYYLEAQEEIANQKSDGDRLVAEVACQVFGKPWSRCTTKQQKVVTQVAELWNKAQAWDASQAQPASPTP